MRSNEERIASVKRRSKELEWQNQKRRGRILRVCSIMVSLFLIVGLSLVVRNNMGHFTAHTTSDSAMTASIFHDSGVLGYIVIGLLAFALGVCVTVLCYRTRHIEHEEKAEPPQQESENDGTDR